MSASTALSLTGSTTRARFLSEPSLPSGPRNSSGWLSLTWQQPPHCHYTCFSQAPNSKSSAFAVRKGSDDGFFSNIEDSDEILDEMFEKHGKVVFTSNEKTSPTADVDDDAECLSCKLLSILSRRLMSKFYVVGCLSIFNKTGFKEDHTRNQEVDEKE